MAPGFLQVAHQLVYVSPLLNSCLITLLNVQCNLAMHEIIGHL